MMKQFSFLLGLTLLVFHGNLTGQKLLASNFTKSSGSYYAQNRVLKDNLEDLENRYGVTFFYRTGLVETYPAKHSTEILGNSLDKDLKNVLASTSLTYEKASDKLYLIVEDQVTGRVSDTDGSAMPGVSVVIKGTSRGTVTNTDGRYSMTVKAGDILVFSFVGYQTKEVVVGKTLEINVVLSEDATSLNELIVTGTRSSGRTKMDTPVPVDVIPLKEVVNTLGQVDLNQILTFIAPSFQSARQAIADGSDHVDPAQLRGLGPDQVLVLVNGKRRHQSALVNVNGTVNRGTVGTDMNAIPAFAVEKIEILRDGAAAQYGSDAIAGVINIVLKSQTGFSANVSSGANFTSYPKNFAFNKLNNISGSNEVSVVDGFTGQLGINYGLKLGKEGFLNITGEYTARGESNRTGLYTGQIFPLVNGQNRDDIIMAERGLTRDDFDMRIGNSRINGGGVMLNAELPVSDKLSWYAFGGYNNKKGNAAGFYRYPNAVPAAARNNVFAVYPNGFLPEINTNITDLSFATGLRGKLGDWNVDLSNTFGQNVFNFGVDNSVNYTQALSSTSFQTTFDAGGLKFLQNTVNFDINRKYDVLMGLNVASGAEFRIDQFGLRAGEEASYRNYNVASGVAAGAQVFAGFLPSNEGNYTRNSKALYLDLEQDITRNFMVSGALRYENYSDFGGTLNYKLASRLKLSDGISLRGSTSTGFRAPSMQQRFYAKSNTLFITQGGQQVPVESGTFTNESEVAAILGIPRLKQETSQSFSVGATAQLARGLELTLDAYQIDIDDRIVLTNNFTAAGNADLRAKLEAANANTANVFTNAIDTRSRGIEGVLNYATRFGKNQTLKLTLAGAFIQNEVKKDDNGRAIIKASDILVQTGQIGNYFNREDQSRIEVANPRSKVNFMANYNVGKLGVMLRFVHFGEVVYLDPTINPEAAANFPTNAFNNNTRQTLDQTFSPKLVTDLTVSYKFTDKIALYVGANNLFDVYQDVHEHANNMSLGRFVFSRRVQQMGFNGRYVFGRLAISL